MVESLIFLVYVIFYTRQGVNSSVISCSVRSIPWLPSMQDKKLLTLHWRSFSSLGNTPVIDYCRWTGCQNIVHEIWPRGDTWIHWDARLTIVDPPWMRIFCMGQGACCDCFDNSRNLVSDLRMFATNCQLEYTSCNIRNHWCSVDNDCEDVAGSVSLLISHLKIANISFMHGFKQRPLQLQRCKTRNHWSSVEAHFQDGAGSVSLLFLPGRAANTSLMDGCKQSPCRLPKLHS